MNPVPSPETPPGPAASPPKAELRLRDALKILALALLVALGIRVFVLEGFRIPTESMEKSLLVGDFVLVSKLHYGPRLPVTLGVPMTDWYLAGVRLPKLRLPGFTEIRRGDPIVFNYPIGHRPLDRRMHYVKRVAGLPGDTVALYDKALFVNGQPVPLGAAMQQRWVARLPAGTLFPVDSLRRMGASQVSVFGRARDRVAFQSTAAVAQTVAAWPAVEEVSPYVQAHDPGYGLRIFPPGSGFGRDQYGPLYVPAKGDTLYVDAENWLQYKALIIGHEGHTARLFPSGPPEIDGVRTHHYVVEQDYYFVLGDNRDSSVDSRVWGFVPHDHVVGKAVMVYFSWDAEQGRPRTKRLFHRIR